MSSDERSSLATPACADTARYDLDRADASLSLARAALVRFRRVLRPGMMDSVTSLAESDIGSAERRVAWLRNRLEEEVAA